MKLDTIYFDYILNGKKPYETRVYDTKRKKIQLLDKVIFKDRDSERTFEALITELSYFKDFKEAILNTGLKKANKPFDLKKGLKNIAKSKGKNKITEETDKKDEEEKEEDPLKQSDVLINQIGKTMTNKAMDSILKSMTNLDDKKEVPKKEEEKEPYAR